MSKYITEWQGGGYIIAEIDWNTTIDNNMSSFHHSIEDAEEDMDELNRLASYCSRKLNQIRMEDLY